MGSTCYEQPVVCFEMLQLCRKLATSILEPVAFINYDVRPLHLAQARAIFSAHDQLIRSEQHMEPGCSPPHLQRECQTAEKSSELNCG